MLALAAAPLGLRCHVYSPEKDSCAFDVVQAGTCASYDDETALARFAGAVDVITYEFENVPAKTAAFLARRKPVLPDPKVLETTQDRLIEKNFVSALKIATAPYASVHSATQLAEAAKAVGLPAVLKTRQLGYDGKGQAKIAKGGDAIAAWRSVKNAPAILEGFINFEREVSVVAARGRDGAVECTRPVGRAPGCSHSRSLTPARPRSASLHTPTHPGPCFRASTSGRASGVGGCRARARRARGRQRGPGRSRVPAARRACPPICGAPRPRSPSGPRRVRAVRPA